MTATAFADALTLVKNEKMEKERVFSPLTGVVEDIDEVLRSNFKHTVTETKWGFIDRKKLADAVVVGDCDRLTINGKRYIRLEIKCVNDRAFYLVTFNDDGSLKFMLPVRLKEPDESKVSAETLEAAKAYNKSLIACFYNGYSTRAFDPADAERSMTLVQFYAHVIREHSRWLVAK